MSRVHSRDGSGWVLLTQRVLLAVMAGYWLSAGTAAVLAGALAVVMPRGEAVALMAMLAFVIYLVVLLWAFTERRFHRLWLVLGGGSVTTWAVVQGLRMTAGAG